MRIRTKKSERIRTLSAPKTGKAASIAIPFGHFIDPSLYSSMAQPNSVKILEVCRVTPSPNSPDSATELSLPLTLFDMCWLKFPPVERLFFYSLANSTDSSHSFFDSDVLPKLKQTLSLTLLHFLPFVGKIIWPSNSHKPIIHYAPGDSVSLTVAESLANFDHLSSNYVREAIESRPLVPDLMISDTEAPIMALQVTVFPQKGFCISITTHHAVLDGKTTTMFMKSWAYKCRLTDQLSENPSLPAELTPFFDRTVIKDPTGLDTVYLNNWLARKWCDSERNLQVLPNLGVAPTMVRATFELSRGDIEKLRKKALFLWNKVDKEPVRLSTFVLTCAYVFICIVKARGGKSDRKVCIGFTVDYRARLDPPVPANYAGNCVGAYPILAEARDFMEEDGIVIVAEKLIDEIRELEKGVFIGAEERLEKMLSMALGTQAVGVAGSNRFEVYGTDFGWGRPKMVEITSIDKTGAISMAESRDGSGGVEVGVVLPKHEMDVFASLFVNGLNALC